MEMNAANVAQHEVPVKPSFGRFLAKPKVENLIKQLFHSRLLDMTLVIANSALQASLAIYHLISKRARGIIVKYSPLRLNLQGFLRGQ